MGNGLNAAVATQAQQFVGYWGYGSLNGERSPSDTLQQITGAGWIRGWQPDGDGIPASLSAAGFKGADSADIWVRVRGDRLWLGRDAFGRMPLYWTQIGDTLWFASRLQLLLPVMPSVQVSSAGLYGYSCFSYVPTPLTSVDGIFAIEAGTVQGWQGEGDRLVRLQGDRLWEWQEDPTPIQDEETAIRELQPLLKGAIDRQIADLSDAPVGVFLSGGLDSSIVAALLVQAGVTVIGYTLDFGTVGISECPYAEQVAQWLHIPLKKVDVTTAPPASVIQATVNALDMPFGDGVTVPLFLLNQAARQDVGIVFNGEGGDQLFAGWTNKPLIAAQVYQPTDPANFRSFGHHYLQTFHRLWGYEAQVFQPDFYGRIHALDPQEWLQSALDPSFSRSLLHRLRRASLMLKGAQNIHPRATDLAGAHGLQVRSPFCDRSLAEWTFRLSGELCLRGACEKYILKRAVEAWLPPAIVWRSKRGMGVPLTAWYFNEWWRSLGKWLNPGVLRDEGRWQPKLASRIVSGTLGGIQGRRMGEILWLLTVWQLWRSQALGESVGSSSWDHPFWLPSWLGTQIK